jgi:hypothetical protein
MGWSHFLDGGNIAVNVADTNGFLVNKAKEFVVDGGSSIPQGSIVPCWWNEW